jgi:hypothetical protein
MIIINKDDRVNLVSSSSSLEIKLFSILFSLLDELLGEVRKRK